MNDEELSPRERRHQRTQQAILTAARALLAEGGVDMLSMRAIADRIDYSPAGLYEYYGSKEEIICAVSVEGHRTLKHYMERVPTSLTADLFMVEIGMAYIEFAVKNPDYFLLMFSTMPSPSETGESDAKQAMAEMMSEASSFPILLQGVERAEQVGTIHFLSGLGLLETAYAFWAIVHGAAMLRVSNSDHLPIDFNQADRLMLEAFVRGMGTSA